MIFVPCFPKWNVNVGLGPIDYTTQHQVGTTGINDDNYSVGELRSNIDSHTKKSVNVLLW